MRMIQTAIVPFASDGLVVTVGQAVELDAREWRELGFRRIAVRLR